MASPFARSLLRSVTQHNKPFSKRSVSTAPLKASKNGFKLARPLFNASSTSFLQSKSQKFASQASFALRSYTTQSKAAQTELEETVSVEISHGDIMKLSLPLPSAGRTVFVLKENETLRHLLQEIRAEDPKITDLVFFYADGRRVAHTTTIDDLTKSRLRVQINEKSIWISFPDMHNRQVDDLSQNTLTVDDVSSLVQRAYFYKLRNQIQADPRTHISIDEYYRWAESYKIPKTDALLLLRALHTSAVVQHFESNPALDKYIFLKPDALLFNVAQSLGLKLLSTVDGTHHAALARIESEIASLDAEKNKYDVIAHKYADNLMKLGAFYLCAQFGVLAHMVWIDFNWDIMEPVTYFVTLTTVIGGFSFFVKSKKDYTYPALAERFAKKKLRALYIQNRFNWKLWNELNEQRIELKNKLGINN